MAEFCLDTFRHPYLRLDESFVWPSVHLIHPLPEEVQRVRELLTGRIPGFDERFGIWDSDPFSGNQKYLIFVAAPESLVAQGMAFELRVLVAYAGGARPGEIFRNAEQDRSPEFATDRIYFKAHLFPMDQVIRTAEGAIHRVDVRTFQEILEASRYTLTHEQRSIWATALFDSIDYGFLQERMLQQLSRIEPWGPGALYPPVVIERMTFCLNALEFDSAARMAGAFREFLEHIEDEDLSGLECKEDWAEYNRSLQLERILSRAGNPHWRFVRRTREA